VKNYLLPLSVVTLLGVGVAFAAVKTDYSHSTNFARYKTYSWSKIQASDSLWEDRIKRAVDQELSTKGWTMVPSGGDVSVAAFGSTQNQQRLETFYDGIGGGWFWRGMDGMATTTVENVPVGTLMVDLFDSQSKKLIFRGTASDDLSDKADKNEKKMEKDVADMFKHFPPPPKG
jgi:hypothetical protein